MHNCLMDNITDYKTGYAEFKIYQIYCMDLCTNTIHFPAMSQLAIFVQ